MFETPDSNLESQSRLSKIANPVFEIPTPMLEISKPCLDALRTHCIFLKARISVWIHKLYLKNTLPSFCVSKPNSVMLRSPSSVFRDLFFRNENPPHLFESRNRIDRISRSTLVVLKIGIEIQNIPLI